MKAYLDLVERILNEGKEKENRTGENIIGIFGAEFRHNMEDGFPLLTTKKMRAEAIFVELEGFIKGITDKKWYQDRDCHIWDDWCNPQIVSYAHDSGTKEKMKAERDLGPIYGFQWRHFGAEYEGYEKNYDGLGIDQLAEVVEKLEKNPNDRRMVVSAWNPNDLDKMALPPCHYSFEVNVLDNKLHLKWNQRSVDTMLGLPFNIASYATLLELFAKGSDFEPGMLIGSLGDTHIYENHIEKAKLQLEREPTELPEIELQNFKSVPDWTSKDIKIYDYNPQPYIRFPIAV